MMKHLIAFAFAFLIAGCDTASKPDFRKVLDAHLAAIAARDLEAYEATITSGEEMTLIFPNGETLEKRDDVVAFHKEWFADPSWRMDPEIVKVSGGEDLSYALIKYDYRDTPEGEPRAAWLVLIFKLENGAWRLLHDQNTRIPPPAPASE
ncbi:MAG: nuclear transport factor 2 family protein [Parvularculaceae bacterium]